MDPRYDEESILVMSPQEEAINMTKSIRGITVSAD
jgi:hypothetical protein